MPIHSVTLLIYNYTFIPRSTDFTLIFPMKAFSLTYSRDPYQATFENVRIDRSKVERIFQEIKKQTNNMVLFQTLRVLLVVFLVFTFILGVSGGYMLSSSGDVLDDITDLNVPDLDLEPGYKDKRERNIGLLLVGITVVFFLLYSPIMAVIYHKMVVWYYKKVMLCVRSFNEEMKDEGFRVLVAENLMWIDLRLDYKAKEFIKNELAKQDQEDPTCVLSPIMLGLQQEFYKEVFPEREKADFKKKTSKGRNSIEKPKDPNTSRKHDENSPLETLNAVHKKFDDLEEMKLIIGSKQGSKSLLNDSG